MNNHKLCVEILDIFDQLIHEIIECVWFAHKNNLFLFTIIDARIYRRKFLFNSSFLDSVSKDVETLLNFLWAEILPKTKQNFVDISLGGEVTKDKLGHGNKGGDHEYFQVHDVHNIDLCIPFDHVVGKVIALNYTTSASVKWVSVKLHLDNCDFESFDFFCLLFFFNSFIYQFKLIIEFQFFKTNFNFLRSQL